MFGEQFTMLSGAETKFADVDRVFGAGETLLSTEKTWFGKNEHEVCEGGA